MGKRVGHFIPLQMQSWRSEICVVESLLAERAHALRDQCTLLVRLRVRFLRAARHAEAFQSTTNGRVHVRHAIGEP